MRNAIPYFPSIFKNLDSDNPAMAKMFWLDRRRASGLAWFDLAEISSLLFEFLGLVVDCFRKSVYSSFFSPSLWERYLDSSIS